MDIPEATIFEKIVSKEVDAEILSQDQTVTIIRDIKPQAQFHAIAFLNRRGSDGGKFTNLSNHDLLELFESIQLFVNNCKVLENGYRLIINTGKDGGQSIDHVHVHILGGERVNPNINP